MIKDSIYRLRQLAEHQQFEPLERACLALLKQGKNPAILPLLALAKARLGKIGAALQTLDRILEPGKVDTLDFEALLDLSGAHLALGQLNPAKDILSRLLYLQPDHPRVLARLGWCLMSMGDLRPGEKQFMAAARLDPGRPGVWTNLAVLAMARDDMAAALAAVENGETALEKIQGELPESMVKDQLLRFDQIRLQCRVRDQSFAQAEAWLKATVKAGEAYYVPRMAAYALALAEQDCHAHAEDALSQGLEAFPNNARLMGLLAEMARVQGHFIQAQRILRQAIALDKENIALWCELSAACLNRFPGQAREAAINADELAQALEQGQVKSGQPDQPGQPDKPSLSGQETLILSCRAKSTLAEVESAEENFDKAKTLFIEILELIPYFVPALHGLGHQYLLQGKIDQALALFNRIRQIDPLKGNCALIQARKFPEDPTVLDRMEKAAQTPSLEGRVRSGILFSLAAAWEKRGDYDRAFGFTQKANQAIQKYLTYNDRDHRNKSFRIRTRFSTPLFQHRKGCGLDSGLPVYVVGMPRSGTTLVEQILSGHSQIFGAGELGTIPMRIQGLNRWERFVGSGRQYPDCVDDLTPYISQGLAQGILDELQAYDPTARHIVDKLPHNFENIGFIKFLFPGAKIISVRRDPRDIAVSNFFTDYQAKHGGMGFAYNLTQIGEQLADHNMMMHHWDQVFPGEILEIHYEDVVDNLEGCARQMLKYIGVAWEPRVLNFNTLARTVKTASTWQVRQPIYKTAKNRWDNYQSHLKPLIAGTNAKILPDPIEDMISLPIPGFLQEGVALFQKGELDGAEMSFKKMLHHNPEHGACTYMVGLVYCRKGYVAQGAEMMEKALEKAPWHKEWRQNLILAFECLGQTDKARALEKKAEKTEGKSDDLGIRKDIYGKRISMTSSRSLEYASSHLQTDPGSPSVI